MERKNVQFIKKHSLAAAKHHKLKFLEKLFPILLKFTAVYLAF